MSEHDYPNIDLEPDEAFFIPDDPFEADWEHAWETDTEPLMFVDAETLFGDLPPSVVTNDERWAWHDARLIGVYREEQPSPFEIGCVDLYAHADGQDLAGHYLPIAAFGDESVATAFYQDVQGQADSRWLAKAQLPQFALEQAQSINPDAEWRPANADEISAYEFQRDIDFENHNIPPPELDEMLLERATAEVSRRTSPVIDDQAAFHALTEIGINAQRFDPAHEPPPFYDADTGTAYWIGVFQPDQDDPRNCVTSILSLARTDSGYEAQLAPCVPGDWDKAHGAAEYLIAQAQKGGIERVFDTAEGMALATDQRSLWEVERGLALDETATKELVDYAAQWEL
jgi:hypothetical protein